MQGHMHFQPEKAGAVQTAATMRKLVLKTVHANL